MPSLNLAIARLNIGTDNFAIWVVNAPYPGGYAHHDCVWSPHLTQAWIDWQEMFAGYGRLDLPPGSTPPPANPQTMDLVSPPNGQTPGPYTSRLMQYLGISLWRWVFDGAILGSLERSQGMAMGEHTPLRLRLEIRDPDLIALPWEIMQREAGQPAISLGKQVLFSRTTTEVDPLPYLRTEPALNILLVLGYDEKLQLEKEAAILKKTLCDSPVVGNHSQGYAPCTVTTLLQPTPQNLIQKLESKEYNVLFYAGHGLPAPDGGLLFLQPDMALNGIELAQVLTRNNVNLAVFNSCWGAQPDGVNRQAIPSSSLAEVLIRHGVPAVLGMRDQIRDDESLIFIQAFAQALRKRLPIDEAVAEARQHLLAIYKFNQPVWTLPVLYLHPDFNGELIKSFGETTTEIPTFTITTTSINSPAPTAYLRSLEGNATRLLPIGVTRIGRSEDNDIVFRQKWVSGYHAEIFYRNNFSKATFRRTYHLLDKSKFGTWILDANGWQEIHREEVSLKSGMQLKFGSSTGEIWQFMIEDSGD
jgi:hypothetical protein